MEPEFSRPEVPDGRPLRVTVVESPACHFCADALEVLTEASSTHRLQVETFDVRDPQGAALMRQHRAAMSPLVLVDGAFFSQGRLPRRKLEKLLKTSRAADAALAAERGAGRG